jgi:hypothetical protein
MSLFVTQSLTSIQKHDNCHHFHKFQLSLFFLILILCLLSHGFDSIVYYYFHHNKLQKKCLVVNIYRSMIEFERTVLQSTGYFPFFFSIMILYKWIKAFIQYNSMNQLFIYLCVYSTTQRPFTHIITSKTNWILKGGKKKQHQHLVNYAIKSNSISTFTILASSDYYKNWVKQMFFQLQYK